MFPDSGVVDLAGAFVAGGAAVLVGTVAGEAWAAVVARLALAFGRSMTWRREFPAFLGWLLFQIADMLHAIAKLLLWIAAWPLVR